MIVLKDLYGNAIVNLEQEISLSKRFLVYAGSSSERIVATMKLRPSITGELSADIEFTNYDGTQRCELLLCFDCLL